jgi:hypothetical protein
MRSFQDIRKDIQGLFENLKRVSEFHHVFPFSWAPSTAVTYFYLYNYYNYSRTFSIRCCIEPDQGNLGVSIKFFFFFFSWSRFSSRFSIKVSFKMILWEVQIMIFWWCLGDIWGYFWYPLNIGLHLFIIIAFLFVFFLWFTFNCCHLPLSCSFP